MSKSTTRRLCLEALETREVPAILFSNGALSVFGTAGIGQIELFGNGAGNVTVIERPGAVPQGFTGVTSVLVDAGASKDGIKLEYVTSPATLIGGAGDDKIQSPVPAALGHMAVVRDAGEDAAGGDGDDVEKEVLGAVTRAGVAKASEERDPRQSWRSHFSAP